MCSGSEAPGIRTVPRGNIGRVSATSSTVRRPGACSPGGRRTAKASVTRRVRAGEPEERGRPSTGRTRAGHSAGRLQETAAGEHALQVGGRHRVPERGGVQLAQRGDRELVGGECEPQVGVGELRPDPVVGGADDHRVVEGRGRQRGEWMPRRVRGHGRIGVGGHQAEERRRDGPDRRHAVGAAEHRDLLDVGHLADVDLLRELAEHRLLDVLVVAEPPPGQRPPTGVRRPGPLPGEHLQGPVPDLQHGRQHLVRGRMGHGPDRRGGSPLGPPCGPPNSRWPVGEFPVTSRRRADPHAATLPLFATHRRKHQEDVVTVVDAFAPPVGQVPGPPATAWADEVRALARRRDAVVLAHNYQLPAIQDVAAPHRRLAGAVPDRGRVRRVHHRVLRRPLHGRDREDPRPRQDRAHPGRERGMLARRLHHGRPAPRLEGRAPRRGGRQLRQHHRRRQGRDRRLLHLVQRRRGRRVDPRRPRGALPARPVPGRARPADHRPAQHARLGGGVPRARRDQRARHSPRRPRPTPTPTCTCTRSAGARRRRCTSRAPGRCPPTGSRSSRPAGCSTRPAPRRRRDRRGRSSSRRRSGCCTSCGGPPRRSTSARSTTGRPAAT